MSEIKEHYIEIIDRIMLTPPRNISDSGMRENAVYKEATLLSMLDELTNGYVASEEIQFIAMYLKTKYNFDIWRKESVRQRFKGKKILN